MTAVDVLVVAGFVVAAAAGASIRYLAGEALNGQFPYGTLVVNIGASGAAGALTQFDDRWSTITTIGALGALSTWSTVAAEVGRLARAGEGPAAVLYLLATITTGVLAAWAGIQLAP